MSKSREPKGFAKKQLSLVRSSAAEYLTFVASSGTGGVEAVYADETIWLTQKMMATLYDVDVRTINYHLKRIFGDSELQEDSVIRNFRITAADGKSYNTKHYNLAAIIAVVYKVNSEIDLSKRLIGRFCRTRARSRRKSPKPMLKASSKSTASCRAGMPAVLPQSRVKLDSKKKLVAESIS